MARTITLADVKILSWSVNLALEHVAVTYRVVDAQGDTYKEGEAIFWRVIPVQYDTNGQPRPRPDNWYQLPAKHVSLLADLTADARQALLALVG